MLAGPQGPIGLGLQSFGPWGAEELRGTRKHAPKNCVLNRAPRVHSIQTYEVHRVPMVGIESQLCFRYMHFALGHLGTLCSCNRCTFLDAYLRTPIAFTLCSDLGVYESVPMCAFTAASRWLSAGA